jgi:hypothetical protein
MKFNISKIKVSAAALLLVAGMTSCNDLDKGNIDPNVAQEADLAGLYAKCYAGLIMEGNDGGADFTIEDAGKSTLLRNIFNFNEISTDDALCWWSDAGIIDIGYNKCVPGTATLRFLYYRLVSNIAFCNQYLSLDEAQSDPTMLAEVRFIRAFNYFQMLDFFGDPAFVTTISNDVPQQAHTFNSKYVAGHSYTRAELLALGREYLFNWVRDELLTAEPNMMAPRAKSDSDADYGRADKASAWFLLSRLYLNAGTYLNNDGQKNPYWDKALEYAEKVINSDYALFDDTKKNAMSAKLSATARMYYNDYEPYDLLFMGDNGSNGSSCEAVLPLLQDGKKTKGWGGSLFYVAALWNPDMFNVAGLPAGTTGNNWAGMRARPQLIMKFVGDPKTFVGKTTTDIRDMQLDDRALFWGLGNANEKRTLDLGDNTSFFQGLSSTKWNNNYSTGADPHDSYDVDIDFFLFRVAEMYLNAAEADMHINGEGSAKANAYIKALRNRAHCASVPETYTLEDVLDERARELYFEGVRRPDLIRYNKFGGLSADYVWDYKGGFPNGGNFDKTRNVYPIPTSEILANSNLTQIDGYFAE